MTPDEIRAARRELDLSCYDMATAVLRIQGNRRYAHKVMFELETGLRPISQEQSRRIKACLSGCLEVNEPRA